MLAERAVALVTAVAVAFATVSLVPLGAAARDSARGYLQILSMTSGAEIVVDGEVVATVPHEEYIPVDVGRRVVELRRRGYAESRQVVDVRAGRTYELIIDLIAIYGVLKVDSPGHADAAVSVNGDVVGFTPFDGLVPVGEQVVEVVVEGYAPFRRSLAVRAGEVYALEAVLQPRAGRAGAGASGAAASGSAVSAGGSSGTAAGASGASPRMDPLGISQASAPEEDVPVYRTWWFWTLVGVGVAGTAAALGVTLGKSGSSAAGVDWAPGMPASMSPVR